MGLEYLNEAFKRMDGLEEAVFEPTDAGIKGLTELLEDDTVDDTVEVIDTEAESEDELLPAEDYVGKVICECPICHSFLFKGREDIEIDPKTERANASEDCPYCCEVGGFVLVGIVSPFVDGAEKSEEPEEKKEEEKPEAEAEVETEAETEAEAEVPVEEEKLGESVEEDEANAPFVKTVGAFISELSDYDKDRKLAFAPIEIDGKECEIRSLGMEDKEDEGVVVISVNYNLPEPDADADADEEESEEADDEGETVECMNKKPQLSQEEITEALNKELGECAWDCFEFDDEDCDSPICVYFEKKPIGNFYIVDGSLIKMADDCCENKEECKEEEQIEGKDVMEEAMEDIDAICADVCATNGDERVCASYIVRNGKSIEELQKHLEDSGLKDVQVERSHKANSAEIHRADHDALSDDSDDFVKISIIPIDECDLSEGLFSKKNIWQSISSDREQSALVNDILRFCRELPAIVYDDGNAIHKMFPNESKIAEAETMSDTILDKWFKGGSGDDPEATNLTLKERAWLRSIVLQLCSTKAYEEADENNNWYFKSTLSRNKIESVLADIAKILDKKTEALKCEEEIEHEDDEVKEVDIELDEFDEKSFDELGEKFLKRTYENVASYHTTKASSSDTKMKLEGVIEFKSGKKRPTQFVFEALDITNSGKARFVGCNEYICASKKPFCISGKVEDKKFISESFNYNFCTKDPEGKTARVTGTVSNRK